MFFFFFFYSFFVFRPCFSTLFIIFLSGQVPPISVVGDLIIMASKLKNSLPSLFSKYFENFLFSFRSGTYRSASLFSFSFLNYSPFFWFFVKILPAKSLIQTKKKLFLTGCVSLIFFLNQFSVFFIKMNHSRKY